MKNTFVKVLSLMMALMMFVGVFGMITVSAACAHENCKETVVPATCVVAGFTRYECNDCGEEFIDNIVPATGNHDWVDQPATEANCTEPAYSAHKKCSVCKAVKEGTRTETAPSLGGHVFTLTETIPATCYEKGYTVEVCARCGAKGTKSNFVDPAHKLIYTVVSAPNAATCTSGTIRVTCSECDIAYDIAETNNHDWKDIKGATIDRSKDPFKNVPNVGETCGFTYKNGKYCTICGATKDMVANDVAAHALQDVTTEGTTWYLGATIPAAKVNGDLLVMTWNGVAFGVGTATKLNANCDAKGYEIKYCTLCNKYVLTEIAKVACAVTGDKNSTSTTTGWKTAAGVEVFASNVTVDAINKTEYHCQTLTKTTTCNNCSKVVKVETKAALGHDYDWTEKENNVDVQKGTVVTPKTCLQNGYTTYTCEFCKETHQTVEATDVAKGSHTWSAAPTGYATGFNCKDAATYAGAVIYTCTYENCDADNPATAAKEKATEARNYTVTGEAKHDYEKKTQVATCIADAAYYNQCKRCGFVAPFGHAEGPTDKPAAGFDAANHVVTSKDQSQAKQLLNTGAAANCTAGQVNRYLCACNSMVDVTVVAALGHNKDGVFTDLDRDGKLDANEKGAAAFAGNCKETAIKQGKYCTVCNTIVEASVIGATVPTTHVSAGVHVQTVAPTCSAKGYDQIYYNCCGAILNVNETNIVATNHTYKAVAQVNQTCYASGTKAHYVCEHCGKVFLAQDAATQVTDLNTLVIKQNVDAKGNAGHNWAISVNKTEETCATAGIKAHKICTNPNCGEYLIDGVAVKPAYDKDGKEIAVSAALNIPAHGTVYQGWHAGVKPTCTTDGYTIKGGYTAVYACSKCDKQVVGKTNHAGTEVTTTVNYTANGIVDCTKPTYDLVVCSVCNATYFKNYKAAANTAHVFKTNDKKVEIPDALGTPECDKPAQDLYCCQVCDYEEYRDGAAALGHKINVNGVDIKVDFACNSADHKNYKGFACVNGGCGMVLGTDFEHDIVSAADKAPTCTDDGHYAFDYCKNCNKVFGNVVVRPATNHANKVFIAEENGQKKYSCPDCQQYVYEAIKPVAAEVYTLSADKVAAGETITVTYAISGAETKFSAKNVNVPFDSSKLTFVGVEAAEIEGLYAVAVDNGNSVGISLVVSNDATGAKREVVTSAEGTVLFTLTFVVNKTASGAATVAGKTVAINAVGNLNGDAVVTADDAQAIFTHIGTNNVAADVNLDGVVTLADVIALAKFAASNKTVADYFEMVGELDKLEDEVFAIYEAGRINDVNNDGVANITDAYELIADLEYAMAVSNYSALGNIVTMADLVAMANKNA